MGWRNVSYEESLTVAVLGWLSVAAVACVAAIGLVVMGTLLIGGLRLLREWMGLGGPIR